jgi:hypothetical protein
MALVPPIAMLLRAGCASLRGDLEAAHTLLADAEPRLAALHAENTLAAVRRVRHGDESWMSAQGIRDRDAFERIFLPGRWR